MRIPFTKMHGAGNDYIYMDCLAGLPVPANDLPELARRVSDRHAGVGSDGLILILPAPDESVSFGFRMFNSDGSEGEMCGNGMRCFARYVVERGLIGQTRFDVGTAAGPIACDVQPAGPEAAWTVTCDLGVPRLLASEVPANLDAGPDGIAREAALEVLGRTLLVTPVSTGVPHAIVFVDDLAGYPWSEFGRAMETHPAFPRRTNTEFVQVLDRGHALVKVWERGSGPTQACGTGACAVVVAGVLTGRLDRTTRQSWPGGDLVVRWREDNGRLELTGPAAVVCTGEFLYAE